MAWKMKLNAPYKGMAHIWNLSAHVGVRAADRNDRLDVELVQRLFIERYKIIPPKVARAPKIGRIAVANGEMDAITAVEIYWAGAMSKPLSDAEVISPAKGGTISYGNGFWTIGYLNWRLFDANRQVWETLPDKCSPQLKAALLTKTMA
ncbi:MAG: hypothetical protein EOO24_59055 [Comamonadaceae bacterium]|nr:MAG: hypothetical protein EOO24_59055 [Comamonadaceae bacterium]